MSEAKRQGFNPESGAFDLSKFERKSPRSADSTAARPAEPDKSRPGEQAQKGRVADGGRESRTAAPEERELLRTAAKWGFSPRTGGKVDGRTLRATGRTQQMNAKVRPEFKDMFTLYAHHSGMTVGEALEDMFTQLVPDFDEWLKENAGREGEG